MVEVFGLAVVTPEMFYFAQAYQTFRHARPVPKLPANGQALLADGLSRRVVALGKRHYTQVDEREGDTGDRFYVIADGSAAVSVDGAEKARLGPGDFFGEIALLRDVPRTATVTAVEALRLYALERDDFIGAVTGHAPSREAADSIVASRLPAGAVV